MSKICCCLLTDYYLTAMLPTSTSLYIWSCFCIGYHVVFIMPVRTYSVAQIEILHQTVWNSSLFL